MLGTKLLTPRCTEPTATHPRRELEHCITVFEASIACLPSFGPPARRRSSRLQHATKHPRHTPALATTSPAHSYITYTLNAALHRQPALTCCSDATADCTRHLPP